MKHITDTVWISSQNLTDSWGDKPKRAMFWHGRAWLHGEHWTIRLEWAHGKEARFTRATVKLAGGDTGRELTFSLGLWHLFTHWLTFDFPWFDRWMPGKMVQSSRDGRWFRMPVERQIGVRIFNATLWFSLWENPNESSRNDPWWWEFNINLPDLLLGREKRISIETVDEGTGDVMMPENIYRATYKVKRSVYKRSRWFRRVQNTTTVDLPVPIPVPGKGENDYDCEDDAIFSVSFGNVDSITEALDRVRDGALRDRKRYGGPDWEPSFGK